jgi:hypothetical protein
LGRPDCGLEVAAYVEAAGSGKPSDRGRHESAGQHRPGDGLKIQEVPHRSIQEQRSHTGQHARAECAVGLEEISDEDSPRLAR